MSIDLNRFKEAVEKTFYLRKLIGIFPIKNEISNPIRTNAQRLSAQAGFSYYRINPFNSKLEYMIITNERMFFYPKFIDAEVKAFEVWEVERKDKSTISGASIEPEFTMIPVG